jgi:transcriptional regulator with XRE-family HTH domain
MSEKMNLIITPGQVRMARAGLKWNLTMLAMASGVARNSISNFENDHRSPHLGTQQRIKEAFEKVGVEFIGVIGVALLEATRDEARR